MSNRIDNPRVSVVVPTYNRANELRRCLDSLKEQTIDDFEVLICDDGSTDETAEVAKKYSPFLDITYDYAKNFGGPACPRNRGIKLARAPYIAFLDSDDWWMPQKLEESLKYLEQGADVVYHDLFLATKSDQRFYWKKARTRDLKKPVFDDLIINGNALHNSSVMVRKELLVAIKGLSEDQNLIAGEDYDAWVRIAQLTDKFKRIPKTLGYYWAGGGNISNPDRLLKIYDAIEERYATEFLNLNEHSGFCWIGYAKGIAYYRLGSYAMAKKNLELVLMRRAPPSIYIKSHWMLLLINLYLCSKIRF